MDTPITQSADDLLQLSYLGLTTAFPDRRRDELLDCARDARERMAFYRARWEAGEPFSDVRLDARRAARLRRALAPGRGAVVCTFQVGPFLQLPFLLSELGFDVMLLMDPEVFEYGMKVCSIAGIGSAGIPYGYWPPADDPSARPGRPVTFITSSDPSATWRMARCLKTGGIVVGYLDGNRGLEGDHQEKNSIVTQLCGVRLRARKGLPYIAAHGGAPFMTLLSQPVDGGHVVRLSPALRKRVDETADAFCARAIGAGYQLLSACVRRDPACWNEWMQLHRWMVPVEARGADAATVTAEDVLRRELLVDTRVVRLRIAAQDVVVHTATGEALALTPPVAAVMDLAGEGATVGGLLDRLVPRFEEAALLDVVAELAAAGFLRARPS